MSAPFDQRPEGEPFDGQCTAHTSSGARCRRHAIRGGTVCATHGGRAPQVKAAAARRLALAEAQAELEVEAQRLGRVFEVEPAEAMLAMVHEAAANVAVLRHLVQQLDPSVGPSGIAGSTGSTAKVNEATPHVLVAMYDAERERLVRWSKACRDAGVDERRVQLERQQAELVARVVRGMSEALLALVLDVVDGATAGRVEGVWRERWPGIARAQLSAVRTYEGDE